MSTPLTIIDSGLLQAYPSFFPNRWFGPIAWNGKIWVSGFDVMEGTTTVDPFRINFYSSADNGYTWVKRDEGNGPITGPREIALAWNKNDLWYVLNGDFIHSFNMTTESWGETIETPLDLGGYSPGLVILKDGRLVLFYYNGTTLYFNIYPWGVPTEIPFTLIADGAHEARIAAIIEDNDEVIHIIGVGQQGFNGEIKHISYNLNTEAISDITTVFSTSNLSNMEVTNGIYRVESNEIIFSFEIHSYGDDGGLGVFRGIPPIFIREDVEGFSDFGVDDVSIAVSPSDDYTDLYLVFGSPEDSEQPEVVKIGYSKNSGGGWSETFIIADTALAPPSLPTEEWRLLASDSVSATVENGELQVSSGGLLELPLYGYGFLVTICHVLFYASVNVGNALTVSVNDSFTLSDSILLGLGLLLADAMNMRDGLPSNIDIDVDDSFPVVPSIYCADWKNYHGEQPIETDISEIWI